MRHQGALGGKHDTSVPGHREGVVNGDLLGPALHDALGDPFTVTGADAALVRALSLMERVPDPSTGILPVMPRRARHARQLERLPPGARELGQGADEAVLRLYEPFGSFVRFVSGSGTFNPCKSPIAFPKASLVPSSSRIRPLSCSTSD